MIFGWVGLFIMGFALQALPRMWHVELPWPRLALFSFAAMLIGIVVRSVAMAAAGQVWAAPVALIGGALELAAILAVVGILSAAFMRSELKTEPYMVFILVALGWFVVQAIFGLWYVWVTMNAAGIAELTGYVSVFQAPLRDIQVHGLALFMILGVSMRIFPALFSLPRISDRRAWIGLGILTTAVLAEVGSFLLFRGTGNHGWAIALYSAWVLLAAGVVTVAGPWKLWKPLEIQDRSGKFIRIAYGWLALSLMMLLLLPAYQSARGIPFSHAYYGAIRHAITVGFISTMIMGVAAKVIPTLTGRDPRILSKMWGPFILINLGCFLRVSLQTLTDWVPAAYSFIGVSGVLEITALGWWGAQMAWMMLVESSTESVRPSAPQQIVADHKVGDVLAWFPRAQEVFDHFGFGPLRNKILQKTVANRVSLRQAAAMRGMALEPLLAGLNDLNKPAGVLRYDAPLNELIARLPASMRVFARYGLSREGQGHMTLAQAAEEAHVSKEELLMALAQESLSCIDACSGECGQTCGGCHNQALNTEAR
jgi:hypothetical protein